MANRDSVSVSLSIPFHSISIPLLISDGHGVRSIVRALSSVIIFSEWGFLLSFLLLLFIIIIIIIIIDSMCHIMENQCRVKRNLKFVLGRFDVHLNTGVGGALETQAFQRSFLFAGRRWH